MSSGDVPPPSSPSLQSAGGNAQRSKSSGALSSTNNNGIRSPHFWFARERSIDISNNNNNNNNSVPFPLPMQPAPTTMSTTASSPSPLSSSSSSNNNNNKRLSKSSKRKKRKAAATANSTTTNRHVFRSDQILEQALDQGTPLIEHGLLLLERKVNVFAKILDLSEGQDKVYKILTSASRIVLHWLKEYIIPFSSQKWWLPFAKEVFERLLKFREATSLTRKFLKLFNSVVFVRLIYKIVQSERFGLLKVLVVGRLSGLLLYFTMNYFVWASRVGIMKRSAAPFTKVGLYGYLLSIMVTLILDFKRMLQNEEIRRDLQERIKQGEEEAEQLSMHSSSSSSSSSSAGGVVAGSLSSSSSSSSLLSSSSASNSKQQQQQQSVVSHLLGQMKQRLSFLHTDLLDQEQMKKSLMINTFKNGMDCVCALNYILEWNFSQQTIGILQLASSSMALQRMWRRTEMTLRKQEDDTSKKQQQQPQQQLIAPEQQMPRRTSVLDATVILKR